MQRKRGGRARTRLPRDGRVMPSLSLCLYIYIYTYIYYIYTYIYYIYIRIYMQRKRGGRARTRLPRDGRVMPNALSLHSNTAFWKTQRFADVSGTKIWTRRY